MHPSLLNGHKRATIIESFNGEVFVLSGGFKKRCSDLQEAQDFIYQNGWQMNVEMIHGWPNFQSIIAKTEEKSWRP